MIKNEYMETKKKLRKDLDILRRCIGETGNVISGLIARIEALEKAKAEEENIISGKEAAKMLGWSYEYVSSTFLTKHGIKYSKGDNGILKISRKDIEDYINTRTKTHED